MAGLKTEDNQKHILTAPAAIIVCVDTQKSPTRFVEDAVTATQNILLAAHNLELGAVYITGYSPSDLSAANGMKNIFSLPDNILPINIIPIGYSDPTEEISQKELVEIKKITHTDKW